MNKKILKLLEQATKKFKEAEAAEQKLSKAVTFVGFEPDDEPRISYFGADGFILIWHGHEVYDWLSLLSDDNSICREQLQFNEDYGIYQSTTLVDGNSIIEIKAKGSLLDRIKKEIGEDKQ